MKNMPRQWWISGKWAVVSGDAFFAFLCNYAILTRKNKVLQDQEACYEKAADRDSDF